MELKEIIDKVDNFLIEHSDKYVEFVWNRKYKETIVVDEILCPKAILSDNRRCILKKEFDRYCKVRDRYAEINRVYMEEMFNSFD